MPVTFGRPDLGMGLSLTPGGVSGVSSPPPSGGALLLEDGSYLLLEDGASHLLLE